MDPDMGETRSSYFSLLELEMLVCAYSKNEHSFSCKEKHFPGERVAALGSA